MAAKIEKKNYLKPTVARMTIKITPVLTFWNQALYLSARCRRVDVSLTQTERPAPSIVEIKKMAPEV